jgi:plastocyanin
MKRAIIVLVSVIVVASAAPASAMDIEVQMVDNKYVPKTLTLDMNDRVTWRNDGTTQHSATTNDSVPGAFTTTVQPGNTSAPTDFFDSVGTRPYHCLFHRKMRGKIGVPLEVDAPTKVISSSFTLTWAESAPPPGTINFDIQVKDPGSDRFVTLLRDQTSATGTFQPPKRGKYLLRGRTDDAFGTPKRTGYSPPIEIEVM